MSQPQPQAAPSTSSTPPPNGSTAYVAFLAAVAAIGGLLFGFDSGVINGTVDSLREAFQSSSAGTGFAVASILLGCAAGALAAGYLADQFGRRPLMLLTAVVFVVSSIGTGAAGDLITFNAFRLLGGLAVGAASVVAPAYISEIAPPAIRGRLASLQQLAIVVGLFSAFLSNYTLSHIAGGSSEPLWFAQPAWRWMFWMEAVPSIAFLVGALLVVESPRYLVATGRDAEAERVFTRTGSDGPEMVREVKRSLEGERRGGVRDLFEPRARTALLVGVCLSAFQQLVGINVIFYYGEVLWQAAGFTEGAALQINVITGLTNIAATLLAMALIDRVGRKPLLLVGSLGMTLTLGALAAAFATAGLDEQGKVLLGPAATAVGLAAANLYIVAFGVSWGPVVWVMLGEMFPNRVRGSALAVAATAQWLANFLVSVTFPSLLAAAGLGGAYGVYATAALLSLLFTWWCVVETRGKRLEEM